MLKWQKEIPTKEGLYLYRFDKSNNTKEWELFCLYETDEGMRMTPGDSLVENQSWKAEWAGPIEKLIKEK